MLSNLLYHTTYGCGKSLRCISTEYNMITDSACDTRVSVGKGEYKLGGMEISDEMRCTMQGKEDNTQTRGQKRTV